MEGSTNTAEAVERVKKGIAYGRSVGSDWAGPLVLNDIDAVISENDRLRSQITELEKALKWNRDALETTDICLRSWNQNRGSPANVEGAIAEASRLLTEGVK